MEAIIKFLNENFGVTVTIIIAIALTIITIKISISFNLNDWQKQRKQKHLRLAQCTCPHMYFIPNDELQDFEVKSWLQSPMGTQEYYCVKCGITMPMVDEALLKRDAISYLNDLDMYHKRLKKVDKHLRKAL